MNIKFEYLEIGALTPYEKNTRKHGDSDVSEIVKSIKKYGFSDPIGVWGEENIIVEGHGRLLAAKKLGMTEVPVIRLDHLTDKERREYAIAHNATAELSVWDSDLLKEELDELDLSDFKFDFGDINVSNEKPLTEVEVPGMPDEPKSSRGQVWQLGKHRLMCGDSTLAQDVEKLMGGELADCMVTDPPYNVNYEGGTEEKLKIENDDMDSESFQEFLFMAFINANASLKPGASFYVWYASREVVNFSIALARAELDVRQELIWNKNSLVLGRSDYQWKHEPCQPAGTMVWTPKGKKPIEELKDGDRVISFDTMSSNVKGYRDGFEIKTAKRQYDGLLYGIGVDGKRTWATDNHEFSVRFNPETAESWSTYLMVNKKGWWRVGATRTYDARGFGLKHRFDQEGAIAAWIVDTFESQADAQMGEQFLACKYGIPYTHWNVKRGQRSNYNTRTEKQIDWLYAQLSIEEMRRNAERLLSDYGRSIKYPLVSANVKADRFSRRVTAKINACNIIPGLMMIPIPKEHYDGANTFKWAVIDSVDKKEHHGLVYSLSVDKYHHYIADGIVTHNCLYGWKPGAAHYFCDNRALTTVMDFDKPKKNKEHPTMKPIELIGFQIGNSTRSGEVVLDLFGGSGSTLIACEQLGRSCRMMEYDPRYVDVIIERWENSTGQKAVLVEE